MIEHLFDDNGELLPPSEYLRRVRPERFSDTTTKLKVDLRREELDHVLATLTQRNDHKSFEHFVRRLTQRTICKNLRPATGPEGGGDGKIDSETFPVSSEISSLWFEGSSGEESWAVTISAKKTWKSKAQKDVENVVGTNRGYKKILSFTNQNPSQKKRKDFEDDCFKKHGIPVTLYTRDLLVELVFDGNHFDLVRETLGVGSESDVQQLGPRDTERLAELNEIDSEFNGDLSPIPGTEDAAWKSRTAALLSRGLGQPKSAVDSRFALAEELARKSKNPFAIFRVLYDRSWTDCFWFDSLDNFVGRFDEVVEIAKETKDVHLVSRMSALLGLLFQSVQKGLISISDMTKRIIVVRNIAEQIVEDKSRPNASCQAEAILSVIDLNLSMIAPENKEEEILERGYNHAISSLRRSEGLAEASLDDISNVVELGQKFPRLQTEKFEELFEEYSETVGKRSGEIERGLVYLDRASSDLENEKPLIAIGRLGQAVRHLTKDEVSGAYSVALSGLSSAYANIELSFAARAMNLASLAAIEHHRHTSDEVLHSKAFVMGLEALAWKSLKTGHLGDSLFAWIYRHSIAEQNPSLQVNTAPDSEKSRRFDACIACALTIWPNDDIDKLEQLPDIFSQLGLYVSEVTLLYRLGRSDALEDIGFTKEMGGEKEVDEFMKLIQLQPATKECGQRLIATASLPFVSNSQLAGIQLNVQSEHFGIGALIAEALLNALEAFAATFLLHNRIIPRGEIGHISVKVGDDFDISIDGSRTRFDLTWPSNLNPDDISSNQPLRERFQETLLMAFACLFSCDDLEESMDKIIGSERAIERSINYAFTNVLATRVLGVSNSSISELINILNKDAKIYRPHAKRPTFPDSELGKENFEHSEKLDNTDADEGISGFASPKKHSQARHISPINQELWDAARWTGMSYMGDPTGSWADGLPVVGLMFKNPFAGYRIFEVWRESIGEQDSDESLRLAILKGVDSGNPFHYAASVGPGRNRLDFADGSFITFMQRELVMEPTSAENLSRFEKEFAKHGRYILAPVMPDPQAPMGLNVALDVSITKEDFHVEHAWKVNREHDDAILMRRFRNPVVPANRIDDAPYLEVISAFDQVKDGKPVNMGSRK